MNEGLSPTLILESEGGKPSKQYRSSPYTVRQYCALPIAQRLAVNAECDAAAGIVRTDYDDDTSVAPYTVGRATKKPKGACGAQFKVAPQAQLGRFNRWVETSPGFDMNVETLLTTSQSTPAMTTAYVHPAPSPALHTLNTPECIDHDEAHPDNLATYAAPVDDEPAQEATPEPLPLDGKVHETTDYERFHLLPENRDIDFRHLRKLVTLIKQKNLLQLKPLDVTPEGGIIDGQHRWAAARELGLPFFYRVGEKLTEEDITTLNIAQKNWTGADYLHYWTVKGVASYVLLTAFRERHPRISFSNAKIMLSEPNANMVLDDFNAGRWVAADEEAAEQVAQLMERIQEEIGFKKTTHTRFVGALYRAVKIKGFDADRLLRKLALQPSELRQQATDRQYLELLQRLYNYKAIKEDHLYFV